MLTCDLRNDEKTNFNPLAPFTVLSLMCRPSDRKARERMMGHIRVSTGTGEARRRPLTVDEFDAEVKLCSPRGMVAGNLLITRIQLHFLGYPCTLHWALPLAKAQLISGQLPGYEKRNQNQSFGRGTSQAPVSLRKMRSAYHEYLPVAHLWAALIHGQQHDRADIWPGSNQTLPTFLAFASCMLELASVVPNQNRMQRFALSSRGAWRFVIPKHLEGWKQLIALPLGPEQLRALPTNFGTTSD